MLRTFPYEDKPLFLCPLLVQVQQEKPSPAEGHPGQSIFLRHVEVRQQIYDNNLQRSPLVSQQIFPLY